MQVSLNLCMYEGDFTREWRLKEVTRAGNFYSFREQHICEDRGSSRRIRVSLTRFVGTDFLAPNFPSLVERMSSFLLVQGGYPSYGRFLTSFREDVHVGGKGERSGDLSALLFSFLQH